MIFSEFLMNRFVFASFFLLFLVILTKNDYCEQISFCLSNHHIAPHLHSGKVTYYKDYRVMFVGGYNIYIVPMGECKKTKPKPISLV